MFRLLKALSFSFALLALSILATNCGSNAPAQVRFVHAMQDGAAMDININGKPAFTGISFRDVLPNQPGYTSVPSGHDTIQGFLAGSTMVGFNSTTVSWNSGTDYTVVATGFVTCNNQPPTCIPKNATLLSKPDNNSPPPANNVAFRVIHASPSGPSSVDVYILLEPSAGPTGNPTISALAYTQASDYIVVPYNPNNVDNFPGYVVFLTAAGSTSPLFTGGEAINPANGAIRTLVLTDVQNGTSMNSSFLELPDHN